MLVYLAADIDEKYEASAYSFMVGNFSIQTERHFGWTVVEAYLHGLLAISNFIIRKDLIKNVNAFQLCTPSKQVLNIITTDRLDVLYNNGWKDPEGKPVFYLPQLKELYFHRVFYRERNVSWAGLDEIGESEYRSFEQCQRALEQILK